MNNQNQTFTISGLTVYIRHLFEVDELLTDVWVEGEISNFSRPASGHWYFTLKDSTAQLKAVMWKSQTLRQRFIPDHGDKIRAHGKISVYEASGQYQLYCDVLQPLDAVGDLHAEFRARWDKLEAEGLFDLELKRPLPKFPRRIGVVTSASTAAFQDVLNVMRRRFPLTQVILSPAPVQGQEAAAQLVSALRQIDRHGVDVILLVRGGGSLEDLWCFNDETLARAIRETRAPVVTGVGHETDTTLVDGTADRRAPTPSVAAEMVTPSLDAFSATLIERQEQLSAAAHFALENHRERLDDITHKLRLVSPIGRIRSERQRLDELDARMLNATRGQVATLRERLGHRAHALGLVNPSNLLARGYALVTRQADGQRVTASSQAPTGTALRIQLAAGELRAIVEPDESDPKD